MWIALVTLFLCGFLSASEQTEKEYQTAVDKAKAEFDAKVKVARDKFAASLKLEMETATKKGDLEGAIKIRDQIKSLEPATAVVPDSKESDSRFLIEFEPTTVSANYGLKKGDYVVNGVTYEKGFMLHPFAKGKSLADYTIDKQWGAFSGSVGLYDGGNSASALTFKILGDGVVLWKSKPVQSEKKPQEFSVDVSGVTKLELVVECPGSWDNAHAVWMDPKLLKPKK